MFWRITWPFFVIVYLDFVAVLVLCYECRDSWAAAIACWFLNEFIGSPDVG